MGKKLDEMGEWVLRYPPQYFKVQRIAKSVQRPSKLLTHVKYDGNADDADNADFHGWHKKNP